jgi:hypothetical protein
VTAAVLASRRETNLLLRAIFATTAAVLGDLAALCQSRGSLIALPLALVLYVAVARDRLRASVQLAVIVAAVAPAIPALLRVYEAVIHTHGYSGAMTRASAWLLATASIAAAGTATVVIIERHLRITDRVCRLIWRAVVATAAAAVVAAVAGVLLFGHPIAKISRAWDNFTTNQNAAPTKALHFTSGVGTSRYDVWRIALLEFEEHPLTGVGADNYLVDYLARRRTHEDSRYPDSVELRALSETGIVGALLFFGFLAASVRHAFAALRRELAPTAALACFAGFSYWFLHASVDWFWEFPALAGPAFALLGLASGSVDLRAPRGRAHLPHAVALFAGGVAAAGAALVLGAAWVAVRQTDEAIAIAYTKPARAYELVHAAARWNPLSDAPAIAEATIAANLGDRTREKRALHAALKRNPSSWYTYFMLGIVAGQQHRHAAARAELERAHQLSPIDLVVIFAQRRLAWNDPLSEREVGKILRLGIRPPAAP